MPKPNVLMFLPDAMQAATVAPEHPCLTPNFSRLAQRGVRFTRAHTPTPTCSPARASLMTGVLPHNHGVLQVEHCVDDDQSVLRTQYPHWAQHLSDAGYKTAYFGKWHIERSNDLKRFGWQVNGTDTGSAYRALGQGPAKGTEDLLADTNLVHYERGPEGYNPILHYAVTNIPAEQRPLGSITDAASDFLDRAMGKDQPWACCVSFSEPNTPLIAGTKAFSQYDVDAIELPANLHDDYRDRPGLYRRQALIHASTTDRQWREARAVYYALISELDAQFGRLVDQIEAAGELENTLIVVLSDHGRYMGAHGFDAHNFGAFEEIYNIPLIAAGPGVARGQTCEALVSLMDVGPTLLDIAGAQPLGAPDSQSFAAALGDPSAAAGQFDRCFAEYHGTRFPLMQRILWEGPWKFVFNGFDFDELYNLDDDPYEMHNLAADPGQAGRMRDMMTTMWQVIQNTNDRAVLETHYSPMRMGVVGPGLAGEVARTRDESQT